MKKISLFALLAAGAIAAFCTGCGEDSSSKSGFSISLETSEPIIRPAENPDISLPPPTVETAAQAEQPAVTVPPADAVPQPAENDPNAAFCGKWEVYSVDGNTLCMGQYGSEDYAQMFQLELFTDGSAVYYDRADGRAVNGQWAHPTADYVQLLFGADAQPLLFPLSFNSGDWDCTQEGWLTGLTVSDTDMKVVLRKTDSFRERAYPQSAQLAGVWSGSANGTTYGWDISTVEQSVNMSITVNGEILMYPYFGEVQPDGSVRLIVEFGDGTPQPFEQSVIVSSDGRTAQWTTENGIVTMTKTASAV